MGPVGWPSSFIRNDGVNQFVFSPLGSLLGSPGGLGASTATQYQQYMNQQQAQFPYYTNSCLGQYVETVSGYPFMQCATVTIERDAPAYEYRPEPPPKKKSKVTILDHNGDPLVYTPPPPAPVIQQVYFPPPAIQVPAVIAPKKERFFKESTISAIGIVVELISMCVGFMK